MNTQKINFRTNYNNKLDCLCFIHLDVAPPNPIPETKMDNTIILIATNDNSHPPVEKKVSDLTRLKFKEITGLLFHLSHGMTKQQYQELAKKENKTIDDETEMAIYYYSPSTASARVI